MVGNDAFVRSSSARASRSGWGRLVYCDQCPRALTWAWSATRIIAARSSVRPEIYLPFTQEPHGTLTIVAKRVRETRAA